LDKQQPGRGTILRKRVQRCLEETKEPTQNLPSAERKAMMNMMKDQNIIVLPADKGKATVVMDREMYSGKLMSLLDDQNYAKLKKDPTSRIERKIKNKLKELEKSEETTNTIRSRITPSYSHPSQIYGLPKIHKENTPLGPIVGTIGSLKYSLAKELARILSPVTGQTSSYINNSVYFVERESISERDQIVSFDVQSFHQGANRRSHGKGCQAS
jgi:energy-coupling factor transporter ATP-binding protein EcfA2